MALQKLLQIRFLLPAACCIAAITIAACSGRDTEQRPLTAAEITHRVEMWSGFQLPDDAQILTQDHALHGWSFSFLTQSSPVAAAAACDEQIQEMGFTSIHRLTRVDQPFPGFLSSHRSKYSRFQVHASKTPKGTLVGIEKINES
jgi:hypothetical protein